MRGILSASIFHIPAQLFEKRDPIKLRDFG